MDLQLKKKDYIWSYIGYIADISVYAVLTPFLTVLLDSFELGLWYTFMGIYSFVTLFDSGFSPIIVRNASYCMAGVKQFKREGVPNVTNTQGPNYDLLTALFKTNRRMLFFIALVIYIIGIFAGIPYICYITRTGFKQEYIVSWIIFLTGIVTNVYFIGIPSFLKGMGAIAAGQKTIALARCIQLLVCLISIICGMGIIGLSLGILIGALSIAFISSYYCKKIFKPHYVKKTGISCKNVMKSIWHNSWKLLMVSIGGYLISQANTLLCSTFLSLEDTASYGLTIQAIQAVGIIAFVYMQVSIPGISQAKVLNDVIKQKQLLGTASVIFIVIDIVGILMVTIFVNPILTFLNAKTILLPTLLVVIVGITNFLDKHSNLYSQFIVCSNEVPFVKPTIISGILVVAISTIILKFTDVGVIGLLLSQMFVQLAYNNWRWPYLACKELKTNLRELNAIGIKSLRNVIASKLK